MADDAKKRKRMEEELDAQHEIADMFFYPDHGALGNEG